MAGPGHLFEVVPMDSPFLVFAGIDWAEESHAVCALVAGQPVDRHFANSPDGIADLATWLCSLVLTPGHVGVAIEVPHGPVVEGLLLRGFSVFAINPKQLDRQRDRYSLAGAKDDRRDAYVLADSLRLDPGSFRPVILPPATIVELRAATRLRTRFVRTRVRLANQLRSQLLTCAPHYLSLSPAANEPWFWELLALLKRPGALTLRRAKVTTLLKRFRISRLSADDVLAVLGEPPLLLAPGTLEACSFTVAGLLPSLRLVACELAGIERHIEALLGQLAQASDDGTPSDATIIDSYPGAGRVVVAGLLAEAYQPLVERDRGRLRAQSGCAPVTRRSGKTCFVAQRRSVNPQLRDVLHFLADAAMKNDPWARAFYAAARARGHSHPRALRGLGDRILDQLIAMLASRQCFDPEARRGRYLSAPALDQP